MGGLNSQRLAEKGVQSLVLANILMRVLRRALGLVNTLTLEQEGCDEDYGTYIVSAKAAGGQPLSRAEATARKSDGPPGFFLAVEVDDAIFFALRRAPGGVLEYRLSPTAGEQLYPRRPAARHQGSILHGGRGDDGGKPHPSRLRSAL